MNSKFTKLCTKIFLSLMLHNFPSLLYYVLIVTIGSILYGLLIVLLDFPSDNALFCVAVLVAFLSWREPPLKELKLTIEQIIRRRNRRFTDPPL